MPGFYILSYSPGFATEKPGDVGATFIARVQERPTWAQ